MKYSIIVCGTITDKSGFKYKVLNNTPLPGTPAKYLDKFNPDTMSSGSTYIIRQEIIDGVDYAMIIEYRKIMPRDKKANRGAYIAVGIVAQSPISVNEAIVYYQTVAEIHAHLSAYRDRENRFIPSFELEKYIYKTKRTTLDATFLIDTLCKASFRDEPFIKSGARIPYNDLKYANSDLNQNLKYLSENSQSLKQIEDLINELEKEKREKDDCNYQSQQISNELDREKTRFNELNEELDRKKERYEELNKKFQKFEFDIAYKDQEINKLKEDLREERYRTEKKLEDCRQQHKQRKNTNMKIPIYREQTPINDDKRKPLSNLELEFTTKKQNNLISDFISKYFDYVMSFMFILLLIVILCLTIGEDICSFSELKSNNITQTSQNPKGQEEKKKDTQLQLTESFKTETKKSQENGISDDYLQIKGLSNTKNRETNNIRNSIPYQKTNLQSNFYKRDNAFHTNNEKTSLWYVYGRVLKLVNIGQLPIEIKEKMEQAFTNTHGRYAKDWAEKLHLYNGKKILPMEDRKKGLLAIWECKINKKKKGHVGFVEEISSDKKQYRLSDFDRKGSRTEDKQYRNDWYTFPTNESSTKEEEGYLNGCLPTFYKLTP